MSEPLYFTSRAVMLSLDEVGSVYAASSLSRPPVRLTDVALSTLRAFAGKVTARTAFESVAAHHAVEKHVFDSLVATLMANELLIREGDEAPESSTKTGFGALDQHHVMLRDYRRVAAYRQVISALAKDKVVVDVGTGSGVMAIFAAKAGARRVYAIEETGIARLATQMFEANGVSDRVTLVRGNSRNVTLPEKADLLIHEVFGADPFSENVLPILADARTRFGGEKVQLLPERVDVYCIGLEAHRLPGEEARSRLEASAFSGQYGIDFSPFLAALEVGDAVHSPRLGPEVQKMWRESTFLTEPTLLRSVDFRADDMATASRVALASLNVTASGRLAKLWVYFDIHLGAGLRLSTAPWSSADSWAVSLVELPTVIDVRAGEELAVKSRVAQTEWTQRLSVSVTRVGTRSMS